MQFWSADGVGRKDGDPPADAIPPMQRRRMSRLSKMALSTALDAAADQSIDYSIFSSQHGEIVRTRGILGSIANGTEVSPAAFAQSVHNTSSGLYTILTKSNHPSTSIAAARNSFACAWLEATTYLEQNPDHRVLLVDFDESIPEEYRAYTDAADCDHALALVLVAADGGGVDFSRTSPGDETGLPMGPQFLAWLQSADSSLLLGADGQNWQWER